MKDESVRLTVPGIIMGICFFLAVVLTLLFLSGCSAERGIDSKVSADAYGQELDACAETARTLAESLKCRISVMDRWGRGDSGSADRARKSLASLDGGAP